MNVREFYSCALEQEPLCTALSKLLQVSHRVINSPDESGVPRGGHGHGRRHRPRVPSNLDVADGAVAPPRDELVDVEDEAEDHLDEHCQVQVPVYALLLGAQRPVGWVGRRLRIM